MTEWIGDTFTSSAGWELLTELVDIGNRMAGTPGERAGAEAAADALKAVGMSDVRFAPFEVQGWTRKTSAITAGEESLSCIALPRSPNATVSGDLVDLEYGLPEDFESTDLEGKIAMARSDIPDYHDRYIHRREKYYHAVQTGADGFIYRNHVEGQLPPTGSVGTDASPIGDIPAIGVSSEVGARLARRHEGSEIEIAVEADIHEATSQNVHATVGPETDQRVLVTSHVDAHDIAEGAMDNGAGTAMVIEIARALAQREADLNTQVEFVVFGAEEVGLVGSEHYADEANHDDIKAIVNNDGVVRGRTLDLLTHGFDELDTAAQRIAERFKHPVSKTPELGPHSDHWPFTKWGVPGYHVTSKTEGTGRGWGHTEADTLDKVDRRNLAEQAILLTELTVELADKTVEIPHRDSTEIAEQLEHEDKAEGMKIIGDWPY